METYHQWVLERVMMNQKGLVKPVLYSNQKHNLPIRIVRPFNNYGPFLGKDDKRLPSDLLNKFLKNKNIILYSDGKPKELFVMLQMLSVDI